MEFKLLGKLAAKFGAAGDDDAGANSPSPSKKHAAAAEGPAAGAASVTSGKKWNIDFNNRTLQVSRIASQREGRRRRASERVLRFVLERFAFECA